MANLSLRDRAAQLRAQLVDQQRLGGAALVEELLDTVDVLYHLILLVNQIPIQTGVVCGPDKEKTQ